MQLLIKMMKVMALLIAVPLFACCQYFQKLYDINNSSDWGWNIAMKNDSSLLIEGTFIDADNNWKLFTEVLSNTGTILESHTYAQPGVSYYQGINGAMHPTTSGYIMPLSRGVFHDTITRSWAGFVKYSQSGDSIIFRTYVDTLTYTDVMMTCATIGSNGYLIGGHRSRNDTPLYVGYIIRTDTLGDTLWTKTYSKFPNRQTDIYGIVPLDDGRIAVGGYCRKVEDAGAPYHFGYYCFAPWYMLLDSAGTVIRDTVYDSKIQDGGWLSRDINGGYYTIGSYDSLYSADPTADDNFPSFIAHLDTNFRTTWITPFRYTHDTGHREKAIARQLHDGSYLIVGDRWSGHPSSYGWAAKVSRYGEVIWNNFYLSDSNNESHFLDVVEKADGNLVFIGASFNDSLLAHRQPLDVWLVGVDSNGCQNMFCAPLRVTQPVANAAQGLSVYPNPTTGMLTVDVVQPGILYISNMLGQEVASYRLNKDKSEITLPGQLPTGMYVGRMVAEDGSVAEVKIMYQR